MTSQQAARQARVQAWLDAGGILLAASERAARSLIADFHASQRALSQAAWLTPAIHSWDNWIRDQWLHRNTAGAMLLNALQEQSLWLRILQHSRTDLLHPSQLAASATRAYRLLAQFAPKSLPTQARQGWTGDSATFSNWIEDFDSHCRREGLVSASRLTLELTEYLRKGPETNRPALLLAGFDRILETQQTLLNAWGKWELLESPGPAQSANFIASSDPASEIDSCAAWLGNQLTANPHTRLMVVVPGLETRRGELERAFRAAGLDFEFSLGVPLAQISLPRSAILLLRWLQGAISEAELDWLIGSGHFAASPEEEIALAEAMRQFRRDGKQRMEWTIEDFAAAEPVKSPAAHSAAWAGRLLAAKKHLHSESRHQAPLHWVSVTEQLLETLGWPGYRPLPSLGFQAQERWQRVLEDCGSLGFDGRKIEWAEFVANLAGAVAATVFAAESRLAPIQITGPFESAGQLADAIWFLGADEDNWPSRGQPDPLLPIGLQREAGMPHATPLVDWALASEVTSRLLSSAETVVFSYAQQSSGIEARPSRLILNNIGSPTEIVNDPREYLDLTERFEDPSRLAFPLAEISGGARTLTLQSLCPLQAFATIRLNAEDWQPAEAGLDARQRGLLLHAVLHRVWDTDQGGIGSLAELQAIPSLSAFVARIVDRVMAENFDPAFPKRRSAPPRRFPQRYLELEAQRLTTLVTEWLAYELQRQPFAVAEIEAKREITIAGLTLRLRLDRLDRLPDGSHLVIDYKTGVVGPGAWAGDRPEDVQLPLYATYAVTESLEGLVFARVRPGEHQFAGRVRNATGNLHPGLTARSAIVQSPLDDWQLEDWRAKIEQLGQDFLQGLVEADPIDPQKTCKTCHLHVICRIHERIPLLNEQPAEDFDETAGGENA